MDWTKTILVSLLGLVVTSCALFMLNAPWVMSFAVLFAQALLSNRIVQRVVHSRFRALQRGVRRLADGEYGERLELGTEPHYGATARAINELGASMGARVDAVAHERTELEAILGGLREGVVAIDTNERVQRFNAAGAAMLGNPADAAKGRPLWEFTRTQPLIDSARRVLRRGDAEEASFHVFRGDQERHIHVSTTPLHGADRSVVGAILLLRDVTDLRRLEGARREFFANASHELKTPIASICAASETMIHDDDMAGAMRARFTRSILTNGRRLESLVEEMVDLARLENADAQTDGTDACDLLQMLDLAVEGVEPLAHEKDIRLSVTTRLEDARVRAPRESVHRIVANLLDNAVKYSPSGSEVDIVVRTENDRVVLCVADRGPGIPTSKRDRIFERFYRLDPGRDREQGGTGLGLAIVKHLVLACGATISVSDRTEIGSVFRIDFLAAGNEADLTSGSRG